MAETGVPLDADGEPIGDLVRWHPTRAGEHADRLARDLGRAELFAATGVRPSGKVPLEVWAQLRADEPQRWARVRHWAGAADLIAHALTGRLVTDRTLAGRTMAYRLPDPGEEVGGSFDPDLLAAVGLHPGQLPEVTGDVAGRVRAGSPGGLAPGTPVVVAGHDHQVGAWAAGVREPGQVANSLGTAESVIRILDQRPEPGAIAAEGLSLVRTPDGHEALVAGSPAAGSMLGWLSDRLGGVDPATALSTAADRARSPHAPLVLPYLHGRQAPRPDPLARAVVVGKVAADGDLACAVVDGLALHARWLTTAQAELAGTADASGAVTGAGAMGAMTAGAAGMAGDAGAVRGARTAGASGTANGAGAVVLGAGGRVDSAWLRAKAAAGPGRLRFVTASEPVAAGAALLAGYRAGLTGPLTLPSSPATRGPDPVYDELFERFRAAAAAAR